MFRRLARGCYQHRRLVLAAWLGIMGAVVGLAVTAGGELANNFTLPSSESQRAIDLLRERFPERAGDTADIVFKADEGVAAPQVRARMVELFDQVARLPHVTDVASPYAPEARSVSSDGTIAFATVQFDRRGPEIPRGVIRRMVELVDDVDVEGLQVESGGNVVQFAQQRGPGQGEQIGLLAAIVILLVTFGSVVAMGLPVITALFGLGVGIGLIELAAHFTDIPIFGPQLATMIGLGVGIDYALFIVTRYRQGLHAGLDPAEATAVAIDTSGRAVVFAGITVVISLLGMLLMGLQFVRGLAIGAAIAVLLVMVASITLLPAMLGFAGHAIDRLRLPGLHRDESVHPSSLWYRWSRFVQRRPFPVALAGLTLLVVLAIPLFSLRLGTADSGNDPTSLTTRRAYDLLSEAFGPGFNGPLVLAAELSSPGDLAQVQHLAATLATVDGVAGVSPPRANAAGDAAVLTVFPATAPQDRETEELIRRLRDDIVPSLTSGSGVEVFVGGITAVFIDLGETLQDRLPLFIGAVIVLSCLLLLAVFRSVVIPVKAAVMNLLSIGAAYGIVVAIFQWGWGKDLVGIDRTGPIESFLPMMLFAIVFGLSMDYEVFLLSRVREEWDRTRDNGLAVADGLAATARVISAAAAIMITVFLSFVLGDDRIIKLFGLGLAAAIFIDATVVRMVLVPAVMELVGEANWWLPRWLDRLLPRLSVEGTEPELALVLDEELALEEEPAG